MLKIKLKIYSLYKNSFTQEKELHQIINLNNNNTSQKIYIYICVFYFGRRRISWTSQIKNVYKIIEKF